MAERLMSQQEKDRYARRQERRRAKMELHQLSGQPVDAIVEKNVTDSFVSEGEDEETKEDLL